MCYVILLSLFLPLLGFVNPCGKINTREIFDATLHVSDETVYWADGETTPDNDQFHGTWIKALNLKWKKIG